jgi:hypothetical protein
VIRFRSVTVNSLHGAPAYRPVLGAPPYRIALAALPDTAQRPEARAFIDTALAVTARNAA